MIKKKGLGPKLKALLYNPPMENMGVRVAQKDISWDTVNKNFDHVDVNKMRKQK